MAQSIHFNDGSVEYLFYKKGTPEYYNEFKQIIYDKLGQDAEIIIDKLIEDADYAKLEINTDLTAYESQLEEQRNCIDEVITIARSMLKDFYAETGRNRLATLRPWRDKVDKIITTINNYF